MSSTTRFDEDTARRVLMVQAYETAADTGTAWGAEDRAWATRVARAALPADAPAAVALAERSRHALHRLLPRATAAQRALAWRGWHAAWLPVAMAVGGLAGLLLDSIGSGQHINLLAPPVWGVLLWNLVVYGLLLIPLSRPSPLLSPLPAKPAWRGLRAWLAQRTAAGGAPATARSGDGPLARYAQAWAVHGAPLGGARAALVLHAAAAALALGLVAGLYARGLVLDYRAGWQSTFLQAEQVQAVLRTALAPAVVLTRIAVPDASALQALRVTAGAPASASAAPWIHLYATMLALFVLLPRLGLAAWAAWRMSRLSKQVQLPLAEPYFQRLLRALQGGRAAVQVLPQGATPSPQASLALQAWLLAALGEGTSLQFAATTAYGQEDQAATLVPQPGTTLRLVLVDLGATPEDDTHGRFLRALQQATPALPVLFMAEEAVLRQRYAHLPERLAERRSSWQAWARVQGVGWLGLNLQHLQPVDLSLAEAALNAALAAD